MDNNDVTVIKEILNAHLDGLKERLDRMAVSYENMNENYHSLSKNTGEELAKVNKDIDGFGRRLNLAEGEISAIKQRIEIGEDNQQGRWAEQDKLWSEQKKRNDKADDRNKVILGLLVTITGGVILMAVKAWLFP